MKYGFIGCGNMGGAIAKALRKSTNSIMISDPSPMATAFTNELGCQYGSNEKVIDCCSRIFLAVKPQLMASVLEPLQPLLQKKKPLIITMAAGLEIARIEALCGCQLPVIRIMPNTPVAVGKGMITYCTNARVLQEDLSDFLLDMQYAGRMDAICENSIDAASALAGCGPAFMYKFLNAMADGGVACGLSWENSIEFAATTMAGAAEMILATRKHPQDLTDAVCSPGGSTIEGVKVLDEMNLHEIVMKCIAASYKRSLELGK